MAEVMRMPGILADAREAILLSWMVAEGSPVKAGDVLAEVETEKALVEIPAERDGVIGKHLVAPGSTVEVGAPILVMIEVGEGQEAIAKALADNGATEITPEKRMQSTPAAPEAQSSLVENPVMSQSQASHQFASPIARKMARENGIDFATIKGSGPDGRIVRRDVEAAIAGTTSPGRIAPIQIKTGEVKTIPHNGMRKAIARRLTESKSTVPHFYLNAPLLADDFLNLRKKINEWASVKVSVTDLLLKTVAAAFQDVPAANVTWTQDALLQYSDADISVAVATENGLITPVIRQVNHLSLTQLSQTTVDLIDRARTGRLKQNEIEGGAFSITNLGMYGADNFSAIINPPQSAILAVGAAKAKPVVIDGEVVIANVINFTLSVDHRAVDGALAAEWLQAFSKRFENPMWMVVD